MEFPRAGRRSGWSDTENKLLWETADEAQQQGLPLKAVFEQIARQTGRRPNSIRNYYYAQVRDHDGGAERPARFVPFTQQEVDWLMEQVLVARSAGQSVRSCLQKLSGGDHSLMLRYQNKYRAVQSGEALVSEARRTGDGELARACDVLTQYLQGRRAVPAEDGVAQAARELLGPIKEFVALDAGARMEAAEAFCDDIARRIGALEARLDETRE